MNIKEMRELPSEELLSEVEKTREKIFRMRFQGKGKDLENPGLLKSLKKDVARLYTVLKERKVSSAARKAPSAVQAKAPVVEAGAQEAGES